MKKIIAMFLTFFVSFLILPITILAQVPGGDPVGINIDFVVNLFTSFTGFCAGVIVITGFLTLKLFTELRGLGRSILSWVVALIVGYIGWFLNLGIFSEIQWYDVLVVVVSFAAGSNVIYNLPWLRELLSKIKLAPVKSKKAVSDQNPPNKRI